MGLRDAVNAPVAGGFWAMKASGRAEQAQVTEADRRALLDGPWQRRIDRLTGAVLVGLGFRLALERR